MNYQESNVIELKEKFTSSICKEIVSFLNADGGTIYIGVKDDGTIIGTTNIDETCRSVADIITQQIEPNPQELIRNELIFEGDKTIIAIYIKKELTHYIVKKNMVIHLLDVLLELAHHAEK